MALGPTVLVLAAGFGWPFELASHFRVHYLLVLVPLTALCLYRKRYYAAAVVGLTVIYHAAAVVPLYGSAPAVAADGATVRVMVVNVHTANRATEPLIELVGAQAPDVLAFLETDHNWLDALRVLHGSYPHRVELPRSDNFGIAMFSRYPGELEIVRIGDSGLPSIRATLEVGAREVEFVAVHAMPPTRRGAPIRDEQLATVAAAVVDLPDPVVLLGDLNVTPFSPVFGDLLERAGLRDTRVGFGVAATWPSGFGPLGIPIDHVLVRGDIAVADLRVGPAIGSDHRPLVVELVVE